MKMSKAPHKIVMGLRHATHCLRTGGQEPGVLYACLFYTSCASRTYPVLPSRMKPLCLERLAPRRRKAGRRARGHIFLLRITLLRRSICKSPPGFRILSIYSTKAGWSYRGWHETFRLCCKKEAKLRFELELVCTYMRLTLSIYTRTTETHQSMQLIKPHTCRNGSFYTGNSIQMQTNIEGTNRRSGNATHRI